MGNRTSGRRLDRQKQQMARILISKGLGAVDIAAAVGCGRNMPYILIARYGRKPPRVPHPLRLSFQEREEISRRLNTGDSLSSIAQRLRRATSTVSREVKANGGRKGYRAWLGEDRAELLSARRRPRKLDSNPELVKAIEDRLRLNWSPEQIARHLRVQHPYNPAMRISHETIYKALYVQGRGLLRKELARHLRTGRTQRRKRGRAQLRGRIPNLVEISQRPPEVNDRAVPGHWEGDLIVGRNGKSAIGTLVERSTRFVMLLHLADGKTAEHVRTSMTKKILQLPEHLRRSLTWDRGREMAQHAQFTVDTGVRVFFCDPHSPWQRGSNENTNGLLRQYFPKSTDLAQFSASHLDDVAKELNERPRQTLGWRTPSEALNEALR